MIRAQAPSRPWTERLVQHGARQWVWLLNGLLLVYAGLPWLSPLLRSFGFERAGQAMFRMYSQFCHQLPERSFALNGFPVCFCHRCTALYTSLLAMSLLYSLGRWQRALSGRMLLLLTLPMVIDGVWHVLDDLWPSLGLRADASWVGTPNFWLRVATGALFGIGIVLWAYPRIQRELANV